ncbi:MAG: TetR family transcriptional regulator [Robiginitomaculum sp.]|nr:MAG: TetR family transcriptional regulator [Robiginitomaculum sp.]
MPSSPSVPRWQRQPEERPGQILDAALAVFRAQGFGAARMDEIAQKAGISKGTIYLYFKSKNAVLEALIDRAITPIARQLEAMAYHAPQGPVTPVLQTMLSFAATNLEAPATRAVPMLVINEAGRFPELASLYRKQVVDVVLGAVTGLIERGIQSGEFRKLNPGYATRTLVAPVLMQLVWNDVFVLAGDTPIDATILIKQHIDIFLNGISPRQKPEFNS